MQGRRPRAGRAGAASDEEAPPYAVHGIDLLGRRRELRLRSLEITLREDVRVGIELRPPGTLRGQLVLFTPPLAELESGAVPAARDSFATVSGAANILHVQVERRGPAPAQPALVATPVPPLPAPPLPAPMRPAPSDTSVPDDSTPATTRLFVVAPDGTRVALPRGSTVVAERGDRAVSVTAPPETAFTEGEGWLLALRTDDGSLLTLGPGDGSRTVVRAVADDDR